MMRRSPHNYPISRSSDEIPASGIAGLASQYDDNPSARYNSATMAECKYDETLSAICYFCGKAVESKEMLRGCCKEAGIVRDFCVELLS